MTPHRRLVAAAARRRLRADRAAARLAGTAGALVAAAGVALRRDLPAAPHPLQAGALARHADRSARLLAGALFARLRAELGDLAGRGYAAAARTLTARVNGTLPVRTVRRREAWADHLDDAESWVIDPPAADLLDRLLSPLPAAVTRLIDPALAARTVWDGVAAGRDRRQIAGDLSQLFGGWETAARRVARTEGLRVATETQLAASEQLADLIPAYQVLAVLDSNTRPDHRKRSGTAYHRRPGPGQLGFGDMPRPPLDRTAGGGWVYAWNCRCVLVPCFGDEGPGELAAAGALVYDHETGHVR